MQDAITPTYRNSVKEEKIVKGRENGHMLATLLT